MLQDVVGGFPQAFDALANDPNATGTQVSSDSLQQQSWITSSYAADDPGFTKSLGFGPYQCAWAQGGRPASALHATYAFLGEQFSNACSFTNPISGAQTAFGFPAPQGGAGLPGVGASGSPWTYLIGGVYKIGAVEKGGQGNCDSTSCFWFNLGTRLGTAASTGLGTTSAQAVFNTYGSS